LSGLFFLHVALARWGRIRSDSLVFDQSRRVQGRPFLGGCDNVSPLLSVGRRPLATARWCARLGGAPRAQPPRAAPLTARGLTARRSQAKLGEAPPPFRPHPAEDRRGDGQAQRADAFGQMLREPTPRRSKARLTTRRPAQPAIFSVIGSKSLPRLDFSSAHSGCGQQILGASAIPPYTCPHGNPKIPNHRAERGEERGARAARAQNPRGEIERGGFSYFCRP
jgi:hypothetical protein